jgi:hypothetical protein
MLSILTAAETEMYESSKKNEELNQQNKLILAKSKVPTENKSVSADLHEKQANVKGYDKLIEIMY